MNKRHDGDHVPGKNNTHPAISILIVISIIITGIAFCCTLFSFLFDAGIISFISLIVTILSVIALLLLVIIEKFFSMVSAIEAASNRAIELLEIITTRPVVHGADKERENVSDPRNESALITWQKKEIARADVILASGGISQAKYDEFVSRVKAYTKIPESRK